MIIRCNFVTVHLGSRALSGLDSYRSLIAWLSFSIGRFNKTVLRRMDTKEVGKVRADIQEELETGYPSVSFLCVVSSNVQLHCMFILGFLFSDPICTIYF